jgi:hypothetical protein
MPIAIISLKKEAGGKVRLIHIALGETKKAAEQELEQHAGVCPAFGPAFREDKTLEFPVDVEEMPEGNDDDLEEWLKEFLIYAEISDEEEGDEEEE